jgi:hypothetical protein
VGQPILAAAGFQPATAAPKTRAPRERAAYKAAAGKIARPTTNAEYRDREKYAALGNLACGLVFNGSSRLKGGRFFGPANSEAFLALGRPQKTMVCPTRVKWIAG